MGILGNLSGQFSSAVSPSKPTDPYERHAPLSRYGTTHSVDKALWKYDRAKEIHKALKTKAAPHEVLSNVAAIQKGARNA